MMHSRFLSQLVAVVAALAFAIAGAGSATAQGGTGQIKGVVTDTTGALVPGAKVTAVSLDNGFTRNTVSGGDGSFLIPLLEPSHYQVIVLAPGFEKLARGPITVQITETADLGNLPLTVGAQEQTVEVQAQESQLQTENATLGKVFDSTLIEALPLSTRNFSQLLSLQAGVVGAIPSTLAFGNSTAQFSVGGARTYDNSVSLDGVNAVSSSSSGAFSIPSPDALDEFKMQTSAYSAEFGRAGGGSIDVTTKSGTNHFHGDGFYFFRNKALDANTYFYKQSEVLHNLPNVAPDLRQNQWGGTVGGPVKRDKLFFFFSFQSTNQIDGNVGVVTDPVYPLLPAGDRSNTAAFEQALGAIYGGKTGLLGGAAFKPDGSNISPVTLALLQAKFPNGQYVLPSFPKQDYNNVGRSDISYASFSLLPKYNEKQYLGNVDYKLTPNQTLTEKFFDSHTLSTQPNGSLPGFTTQRPGVSENASITHSFTVSATTVNELKLGYLRQVGGSTSSDSGLTATAIGMKTAPDAKGAFPTLFNAQDALDTPASSNLFSSSTENQYSISDIVSKTFSSHNLRFGVTALSHQLNLNSADAGAVFTYQFADLLLGAAGNVFLSAGSSGSFERNFRFNDYGYFVQDDYKVLPNLTLNLGLRWDYYAWPSEAHGKIDNFVPSLIGEGAFGIPTAAQGYTGYTIAKKFKDLNPNFTIPGGVTLVNDQDGLTPNYKNYAPRVGFAWVPYKNSRATSVRGGFGLFFNRGSSAVAEALVTGPPFNNRYLVVFPGAATLQDPFTSLNLPLDSQYPIWSPRVYNPTAVSGLIFNAAAQKVGNPYTEQWNLSVQQELPANFLFELAYQGSNGVKLLEALSENQAAVASAQNPIRGITTNIAVGVDGGQNIANRSPVAGIGPDEELAVTGTTASSHFNALEATLNKRLSHGLQFLSAFTWSRSEDSDTVGQGGVGSGAVPPNDNLSTHHMSLSGNDRKLRFTTSAVYNIPDPFKSKNGLLGRAFGGWGMAAIWVSQTGGPISFDLYSITEGTSAIKYDSNLTASLSPGYTLQQAAGHGPARNRLSNFFNTPGVGTSTTAALPTTNQQYAKICDPLPGHPSALACPGATAFGTLPTNTFLRNPGQKSVDLSLTKTTKLLEHYNVEIRADFFNAFNWAEFAGPDSSIISPTFGLILGTTVDPRVIQASAKFKF